MSWAGFTSYCLPLHRYKTFALYIAEQVVGWWRCADRLSPHNALVKPPCFPSCNTSRETACMTEGRLSLLLSLSLCPGHVTPFPVHFPPQTCLLSSLPFSLSLSPPAGLPSVLSVPAGLHPTRLYTLGAASFLSPRGSPCTGRTGCARR